MPTQTITVVNQARASQFAIARVERAVTDQSMQLRAAWGTPCVQWGPGGWPLYLRIGGTEWGVHYGAPVQMQVYTDGLPYRYWSAVLSHEIVESLEDPTTYDDYAIGGVGYQLEIADPVAIRAYRLDGVWVSDFTLPAWYAGAVRVTGVACSDGSCSLTGPIIAPIIAPGPYDEMGVLTRPWDAAWGQD